MASSDGKSPSIHVLVVDDEAWARRNLTLLLRDDPDIASVIECGSGVEAIKEIRQSRPDLVFLDVQMPECDGFDVLELLGADMPETVIFVTAYDTYALRAFEAGALDYLLKPFDDARFHRALARAKEKLAHYAPTQRRSISRIAVKSRSQTLFLNVSDIDWIEAASYYACLHVGADTHILRRTLQELEQDLDARTFARIHRSIIVNLDRVRGLELQDGGEYEVVLNSTIRLRLSRRYRKRIQDRLAEKTR
ncbi:LytR/AlgR family response regulator transcription factor [Dyella nitratireducens]|uniref:DNA-binding response regulator n=1 Tax=Dyella nitratireducens TaxID=1849580 RepID=A0ABQ1FK07_9GAMM|nr:response regulator [Dyella nitratireducens]GGA19376.1 DNA-binding response regulator [Dyella nitratireducens]GLQ44517.1 DNA-binding response regulator [Dyella nitratireducens]